MSDASKLIKKIKDEDIKFVDLRFTDPKGKMQHVTFHSDSVSYTHLTLPTILLV